MILVSTIVLSSCAVRNVDTSKDTEYADEALKVENYFPTKLNVKYIYEGHGNEFASYSVFTDYFSGNRMQLRYNNGGTEYVEVLENNNSEISVIFKKGECYYRENMTQTTAGLADIILKEPLVVGTTWTSAENKKRYISATDFEVATPSGTYLTVEVTTEENDGKTLSYYAQDVGLVQTVSRIDTSRVFSMLSKIEYDVPFAQNCSFFYPDVNADKIYYVERKLYFNTNDVTKQKIESEMKKMPKGDFGRLLGPNTVINNLYINTENIACVDFSDELLTEMNAGAGYEGMIMQCITNTIGNYYDVDKVYITVSSNPYSSGHIEMKEDEYFTVDLSNCVELK